MADNEPTAAERAQAASEAASKAMAMWQGDYEEHDLTIPYKREDEQAQQTDEKQENTDTEAKPADEPAATEAEAATYAEPEPVVTVDDPGQYQPQDYSFDIEIDGRTHKVTSSDQADQLADEYAEKLTAKQLGTLIRKGAQIDIKQERDKVEHDRAKEKYDSQLAEENARLENVQALTSGFEYLMAKGKLPQLSPEEQTSSWDTLDLAEHPNVKAHMDLINYMMKENELRRKAGVPEISSALDAYNAYQLENKGKQEKDEQKAAGEARKAAGARVASQSASNQGMYVPKGIAVGRTGILRPDSSAAWEAVLEGQS